MTDIGGGIFSLVVLAIFLKFWKPKNEWHFSKDLPTAPADPTAFQEPDVREAREVVATLLDKPMSGGCGGAADISQRRASPGRRGSSCRSS